MGDVLTLDAICNPSEDIVARNIEGELIIVPLAANVGDIEDALYTLNKTGVEVWARLDGKRTLRSVVAELAAEYPGAGDSIERDVIALVNELVKRHIVTVQPE